MVAKRSRRLASRRIYTLGSRNCPQAAAASAMPRSPRENCFLQPAKTIPAPSKHNASPSNCRSCTAHLRSAVQKADGPMQLHARPGVARKAIAFRPIIISARERVYYLTRPFTNPGCRGDRQVSKMACLRRPRPFSSSFPFAMLAPAVHVFWRPDVDRRAGLRRTVGVSNRDGRRRALARAQLRASKLAPGSPGLARLRSDRSCASFYDRGRGGVSSGLVIYCTPPDGPSRHVHARSSCCESSFHNACSGPARICEAWRWMWGCT